MTPEARTASTGSCCTGGDPEGAEEVEDGRHAESGMDSRRDQTPRAVRWASIQPWYSGVASMPHV